MEEDTGRTTGVVEAKAERFTSLPLDTFVRIGAAHGPYRAYALRENFPRVEQVMAALIQFQGTKQLPARILVCHQTLAEAIEERENEKGETAFTGIAIYTEDVNPRFFWLHHVSSAEIDEIRAGTGGGGSAPTYEQVTGQIGQTDSYPPEDSGDDEEGMEIKMAKKNRTGRTTAVKEATQRTPKAKQEKETKPKVARVSKASQVPVVTMEGDTTPLCWCGCGGQVKVGSRFLQGHDARLKGRLLKWEAGEITEEEFPDFEFVSTKVFPLLEKCAKCGKPFMGFVSPRHDGYGPYCFRQELDALHKADQEVTKGQRKEKAKGKKEKEKAEEAEERVSEEDLPVQEPEEGGDEDDVEAEEGEE